jgi:hypothetical protein
MTPTLSLLVRILRGVKTRTLLLLAVGCGLVILIAGSIKVFLIADDTSASNLAVGKSGEVDGMTVTLESVRRTATQTLVGVSLIGVDDPYGALSFEFGIVGKQLKPTPPNQGEGRACAATSVQTPTKCVLAFDTIVAPGVLIYERDDTLRWDVPG